MPLLSWALLALAAAIIALVIWVGARPPPACGICGNPLKRKRVHWRIGGKEVIACASCNRTLEARQSREAVKAFLGEKE